MLFESGQIMTISLDGMSSGPLQDMDQILTVKYEKQYYMLAQSARSVLRSLLFMGYQDAREMRRVSAHATGLRMKEPDGVPAALGQFITANEARRATLERQNKAQMELLEKTKKPEAKTRANEIGELLVEFVLQKECCPVLCSCLHCRSRKALGLIH